MFHGNEPLLGSAGLPVGTEEMMTIDELARLSGTTSRNIRAYQTRGLLPPPTMVGRVGYYDQGHLARLKYVARLQERGFSLAAIHDLLQAWEEGRSVGDILGFEEALTAPWSDETPVVMPLERLLEMFPEAVADPEQIQRAVALGLVTPVEGEEEGLRVRSPRLLEVGAALVASGVPLAAVLDEHENLTGDMHRISERFVRLFERYVWEPFVAAGLPAERLPAVTEALNRMRPAASAAVQAVLAQAMEEAVASSTAEQVRRLMEAAGSVEAS